MSPVTSSDAVPCVKEVHIPADSGTGWAGHDVPVRVGNLCGHCQEEGGAVPEECPACYGFGYVEPMRIGLTGHASPRYDKARCDACDGTGRVVR